MTYRYTVLILIVLILAIPIRAQGIDRDAALELLAELQERQQNLMPAYFEPLMRARAHSLAARASAQTVNRISVRTEYVEDDDDWVNSRQHRFAYENAQVTSQTEYRWHAEAWAADYRTLYGYAGGVLATVQSDEWHDGAWRPQDREVFSFVQDNLVQVLYQVWEDGWVDDSRSRFIYEGGVLVRVEEDDWTGTGWQTSYRALVTQVGPDLVITEQVAEGSEWVNDGRSTFHGLTASELLETQLASLDDQYGLFFLLFLTLIPDMTFEVWEEGAWRYDDRFRWTVNDDGRREHLYIELWEDGEWQADARFFYEYLASGLVSAASMQMVDYDDEEDVAARSQLEEWINFLTEDYSYNAQDLLVEATSFIELFEMRFNVSRTTFDWVALQVSADPGATPLALQLEAPYPNPFTLATTLTYHLTDGGHVNLRVYDATGRLVAVLVDDVQMPGQHTAAFDAAGLASGHYFVRLEAGELQQTRSVSVLK
jgi:hypothetical protein